MRISNTFSQWVISLAVAVALLGAPVLPAVASATADATAHAMHADHGKTGKTVSDRRPARRPVARSTTSAAASAVPPAPNVSPQRLIFSVASFQTYSILFPTVLHLDDRLTVAVHNRPRPSNPVSC